MTRCRQAAVLFLLVWLLLLWAAPDLAFYYESADHGLQLSVGRQILLGKRLFVDLFLHYGPLTALTSAGGLALHPSLVPETVICSLGYALALTALFAVSRRLLGLPAALGVVVVDFLLLARFYKWYYWLFPTLTVFLLMRSVRLTTAGRRYLPLGLCCGLAFLYRTDLGVGCLGLSLGGVLLTQVQRQTGRQLVRFALMVLGGFALPVGAWLGVLAGYGGSAAVTDYARSYLDSFLGVTQALALPIPRPRLELLWRPNDETAAVFCYYVLPTLAALGLVRTLAAFRGQRRPSLRQRLYGCVCLGALGFLPQALHRAGLSHFLQVMPLFALATAWTLVRLGTGPGQPVGRVGVGVCLGMLVVLLILARPVWMADLSFSVAPLTKFRALARPTRPTTVSDCTQVSAFLRTHTTERDRVLQFGIFGQVTFFSGRCCAGNCTCYAPGFLDTAYWQERHLAQVQRDDPRYVVFAQGFLFDGRSETALPCIQPRLWQYIEEHYPVTVFRSGAFVVLAKQEPVVSFSPGEQP